VQRFSHYNIIIIYTKATRLVGEADPGGPGAGPVSWMKWTGKGIIKVCAEVDALHAVMAMID